MGQDGGLAISGVREPTKLEEKEMHRVLVDHIRRLPQSQSKRLTRKDVEDFMLRLGHGRYGKFVQVFEMPEDVDEESIDASYEDGVLKVILPRHQQRQQHPYGAF